MAAFFMYVGLFALVIFVIYKIGQYKVKHNIDASGDNQYPQYLEDGYYNSGLYHTDGTPKVGGDTNNVSNSRKFR